MLRSYKSSLLVLPAILLAGLYINTNVFADSNDVDFSITVNPSLTLALSTNAVNFSITPTAGGAYNSANFTVTSATNNAYGYTLVMGTSNVDLTSNTVNPTTGTNPIIPTLAETQDGISAADFEASTDSTILNHYGVAIGTNNFNAMKTTKQVKKTTVNNASGVDNTTIALASKLDLNTVPGTYSTTINFQMTANPLPGGLEEAYQNAGKAKKTIGGKEYYAMQDMTPTICSNVTVTGDIIEVYDKRDNTIYHIGKLADNRCWLLDNLALDLTNTDIKNTIYDSGDSTHDTMTNATNEQLGYLYNGGRADGDSSTDNLPIAGLSNLATGNNYSVPLIDVSNVFVVPQNDKDPLKDITLEQNWKVGGYYNFCAASAGSYCYGDGTDSGTPVDKLDTDIDVGYDICPSGWRMPTGKLWSSEYYSMIQYGSLYDRRIRLRLPLSGIFRNGSTTYIGLGGGVWSSTYSDNEKWYSLSLGTGYIDIRSPYRYEGMSVRCIAKTGTE